MASRDCIPASLKTKLKGLGLEQMTSAEQIQALNVWRDDLTKARRQSKIQAIVYFRAKQFVIKYTDKDGNLNPQEGLQALIYRDRKERPRIRDGEGLGADMDSKITSIRATYQRKVYNIMEELSTKWLGLKGNGRGNEFLVKALFGENTDLRFKKMAKSWENDIVISMRNRFNRAGGDIKLLKDWRLPRVEDVGKVRAGGEAKWIKMVKDNADTDRMDVEGDIDSKLSKLYHSIISDGVQDEIFSVGKGGKVANRQQYEGERFIHFNNAESWLAYHKAYGEGTPYNAMMNYISMMSNAIGMMETLGPNPHLTFESLSRLVSKDGRGDAMAARHVFENQSGQTAPENKRAARVMEGIRNITSYAKLTLAILAAPSDLVPNLMASRYNGLSGMKTMMNVAKMLATGNMKGSRQLAADLGMSMDFMVDSAHAAHRYLDVGGHGIDAKLAGFTIKGSGLNHWTIANKMGYHFSFMQGLGKSGTSIRKNKNLMMAFARYGLDDSMVSEIIASKKLKRGMSTYLDLNELSDETGEAVTAMILAETKLAVPEADIRVKAFLNQGTSRGTLGGEAIRTGAMFKTFMTSMVLGNWARIYHGTGYNRGGRLAAGASMLVGTTILGTMSLQLQAIAKGEPLIDWESPHLWAQGFQQGGGLLIVGDVLAPEARTFGGLAEFIGGPAVGMMNKYFWKGALGSLDDARDVDKSVQDVISRLGDKGLRFAVDMAPGQFFYSRVAWDRYVLDELRRSADPYYDIKKVRRQIEKDKTYSERWW